MVGGEKFATGVPILGEVDIKVNGVSPLAPT